MDDTVRRHGISITLSTLISVCTLAAAFWVFAKPWVANAVAEELKAEISEAVESEVAPLKESSRAMLRGQIAQTRRDIARLEYKAEQARRNPEISWSAEDAVMLSDLQDTLRTQRDALEKLK